MGITIKMQVMHAKKVGFNPFWANDDTWETIRVEQVRN